MYFLCKSRKTVCEFTVRNSSGNISPKLLTFKPRYVLDFYEAWQNKIIMCSEFGSYQVS